MSTARKLNQVSVADYLAGELASPVKHEYLGGAVYAMAGGLYAHGLIASNALAALHARLRGRPCRALGSDIKVRIELHAHDILFYYPDVSVVCQPHVQSGSFQESPVVLVEVLSRTTRRIDEREKKAAYLTIPSLRVYLLVEQELAAVAVFRRTGHEFVREFYEGLEAVIPLPEIGTELPLAAIYETVVFAPEGTDDDD